MDNKLPCFHLQCAELTGVSPCLTYVALGIKPTLQFTTATRVCLGLQLPIVSPAGYTKPKELKTCNCKFCLGGKENDGSEAVPSHDQPWSLDSHSLFQACFNFQTKLFHSCHPSSPGSGELAA